MRGFKILVGFVIVGLLFIPCLIVGTGNVGFKDYTLKQNQHLRAWYVPEPSLYGKNFDKPYGWRARGRVTTTVSTYSVSCGTGFSSHPPTYKLDSKTRSASHLSDWDTMGAGPAPHTQGATRQAKIDVLWLDLPEPFRGESPMFPKVFPSKYFTLARAKGNHDPSSETSDARTCSQLLGHRHLTTFFASPLGWLVILGCIAMGLYILFAGRGGGGGGGTIRGHATKSYSGTGYDIRIGNISGHSTPRLGGSGHDIKLYPGSK